MIEDKKHFSDMLLVIFSIAFFLASWLVANVSIGEAETWVSAVFIVVLAIPSYYVLSKWVGVTKGLIIIIIFSIIPIVVESIGILTGFPYGGFHYTDRMGFKILGLVPWSVAFAFAPLVFGTITLSAQISKDARIALILSAAFLVVVDLVLDPAAVLLNIWVWDIPGPYYGIPVTNYTGWYLTAFITSIIMHMLTKETWKQIAVPPALLASSLLLSLAFWTGYSFWTGLLVPVIIGFTMLVLCGSIIFRREKYAENAIA
ncbi:MAG: carotenoid biosynthesis protein [Candidatus Thorarchaeota archaeon]